MHFRTDFDPLLDLFTAQSNRPEDLQKVDLNALSPFLRSLLVTDGTVTNFIQAYTMEPVEVVVLGQRQQVIPTDNKWLELSSGTAVISRRVILQGRNSHIFRAYASSTIVTERLAESFHQGLERDSGGLGHTLNERRIESFRELLWYGKQTIQQLPDSVWGNIHHKNEKTTSSLELLSRTYRVITNGKPAMLISEVFPSTDDWVVDNS